MKLLESILPILTTIDGVTIPVTLLQGIYIAASQRKMEQLEGALRYEVRLLHRRIEAGKVAVSKDYVKSEAFSANVVQALRASEIAESEEKIKYIARALANCTLEFGEINLNKNICMRILEQITVEEIDHLIKLLEYEDLALKSEDLHPGTTVEENVGSMHIVRGLLQLGLLGESSGRGGLLAFRPSILARHLMILCADRE